MLGMKYCYSRLVIKILQVKYFILHTCVNILFCLDFILNSFFRLFLYKFGCSKSSTLLLLFFVLSSMYMYFFCWVHPSGEMNTPLPPSLSHGFEVLSRVSGHCIIDGWKVTVYITHTWIIQCHEYNVYCGYQLQWNIMNLKILQII